MGQAARWLLELRRLFDGAFDYDWVAHLERVNTRYGLANGHELTTEPAGCPPAWVVGDAEAIVPGRWVLVVSLNPSLAREGRYDAYRTPEQQWNLWRTHAIDHWYPKFFRPLVQLAAGALGDTVTREQEQLFASRRMLFVEICPYASRRFALRRDAVVELARSDAGFQLAARIERLLIEEARPALILVNGSSAVRTFEALHAETLHWDESRYRSVDDGAKRLRHWEGWLATTWGRVPVAGFVNRR